MWRALATAREITAESRNRTWEDAEDLSVREPLAEAFPDGCFRPSGWHDPFELVQFIGFDVGDLVGHGLDLAAVFKRLCNSPALARQVKRQLVIKPVTGRVPGVVFNGPGRGLDRIQ